MDYIYKDIEIYLSFWNFDYFQVFSSMYKEYFMKTVSFFTKMLNTKKHWPGKNIRCVWCPTFVTLKSKP